ncbi:SurA N-terminal domain-containing protein [Streptomyces sp. H27-D2]|uniref:SurA N-terminal domain-containing protein n=1 Tax=Streptomyces sp. H27-D2 TaxID=3046304 RepID=UPI002DB99C05|nr:SurA N-terminal domain-containing protein [Streptomyces sp. H27-D2]MEC4017310.1 SurA N-terminal domain-containing protein [Streptomyces sp. H27-D2]
MHRRRTALSVSAAATLLALGPLLTACGSAPHPGAAAVVDGNRITVSQVQAKVKHVRDAQRDSPQAAELIQNTGGLSRSTLNGMVFERILLRVAKDAEIDVSRRDVQQARSQAEQGAGGAARLREMWLQQGIAPDQVNATVRNELLLEGVARSIGADRRSPEGQQKLVAAVSAASKGMDIDVNPRFGTWDDKRMLSEVKEPWLRKNPAAAGAQA